MDTKREGVAREKKIRMAIYLTLTLAAVGAITWRLSKLAPAAPAVQRATLSVDAVKRGPRLRDVKGSGTLVPEDILWIPAASEGQVTRVNAKSGEKVKPDSVLVVLTNPDMELAANDLEWQIKQAEANLADLKVKLESERLNQQSVV